MTALSIWNMCYINILYVFNNFLSDGLLFMSWKRTCERCFCQGALLNFLQPIEGSHMYACLVCELTVGRNI